jgi:hypothetical protein
MTAMAPGCRAQFGGGVSLNTLHKPDATTPLNQDISWFEGPTVSAQYEHGHRVRAGAEARASFLGSNGATVKALVAGPRVVLAVHKLHDGHFYGEALFGVVSIRPDAASVLTRYTGAEYVVGLDAPLFRLKHWDWRLFEYSYVHVLGQGADVGIRTQFSTGLIAHF